MTAHENLVLGTTRTRAWSGRTKICDGATPARLLLCRVLSLVVSFPKLGAPVKRTSARVKVPPVQLGRFSTADRANCVAARRGGEPFRQAQGPEPAEGQAVGHSKRATATVVHAPALAGQLRREGQIEHTSAGSPRAVLCRFGSRPPNYAGGCLRINRARESGGAPPHSTPCGARRPAVTRHTRPAHSSPERRPDRARDAARGHPGGARPGQGDAGCTRAGLVMRELPRPRARLPPPA
jgi:hypothetical protein